MQQDFAYATKFDDKIQKILPNYLNRYKISFMLDSENQKRGLTMKYVFLLMFLALLLTQTSAQTLSASSPVQVLEKKWNHDSTSSSGGMLDTDPFQPNNETNQLMKDRKQTIQDNVIRKQRGLPEEPLPTTAKNTVETNPTTITTEISRVYNYQIKVRNTGSKTIRIIAWEYIFLDPTSKQEVGKHTFTSKTRLKKDETEKLTAKFPAPPVRVVNAKNAGKDSSESYIEQINIKSVQYDDGSVWQSDLK
jgi:hypothetical protein